MAKPESLIYSPGSSAGEAVIFGSVFWQWHSEDTAEKAIRAKQGLAHSHFNSTGTSCHPEGPHQETAGRRNGSGCLKQIRINDTLSTSIDSGVYTCFEWPQIIGSSWLPDLSPRAMSFFPGLWTIYLVETTNGTNHAHLLWGVHGVALCFKHKL